MSKQRLKKVICLINIIRINLAMVASSLLIALIGKMTRARADAITRHWATQLLNCARIRRTIMCHGQWSHKPHQATIIMSNHTSLYDIPLILEAFPKHSVRMLSKKELFKIPLFGLVLKQNEFIAIDRHNNKQARKDLQKAEQKLQDGILLWCAPEGKRSKDGKLGPFKKGVFKLAMQTKAQIIPVTIQGAHHILPAYTWNIQLDRPVTLHIESPIDCKDFNKTHDLMQALRARIQTHL